jgi:hypothetical protein
MNIRDHWGSPLGSFSASDKVRVILITTSQIAANDIGYLSCVCAVRREGNSRV